MRVFVAALARLCRNAFTAFLLSVVLSAAPSFAQALPPPAAAPQTQKPPAPAPAPQTQKPAPAQPAPTAPVPRFQDGMKYAFVYVDQLAAFSNAGKLLSGKVQALQEQKLKELQDRNKALQAAQEKLDKGASVMNETARAQLQADIERQQRDLQRASEDAQQEVNTLTQQLQQEFYRVVAPAIERVAKAKQVHFVFNAQESGLVWADATMDLTAEVIKELDAGATAKPAAAAPPVQTPAKP
jgi:Skp family chaperone for outer membrane proteins